ncbi:MAG: hypothetical protein LUG85_07285 [Clostridiales bacterium]|nr:hypothetical protein [Clostridiales bacterium]
MNKQTKLSKINDVEENIPTCTASLDKMAQFILVVGILCGIIVGSIGLFCDDEDYIRIILIVSGIILIAVSVFSAIFFEGMSKIVENTYRSAEYAKIQAEILCSEENILKSSNKVQNIDDELPTL